MARTYRYDLTKRAMNALMRAALRSGLAPKRYHLLTVRGRRSGRPFSTPVIVSENAEGRWLVSPYGDRGWTKNARHAGTLSLSRGRQTERVAVMEVEPSVAAPVLRQYIRETPITQPYFAADPESSLEEFAAEAHAHPVFRVTPLSELEAEHERRWTEFNTADDPRRVLIQFGGAAAVTAVFTTLQYRRERRLGAAGLIAGIAWLSVTEVVGRLVLPRLVKGTRPWEEEAP